MKKDAYFTVEATFVVTITMLLVVAVLYTGLYVHDRIITETVTERWTARWEHQTEEEKFSVGKFKKKLNKELSEKLFLVPIYGVDVEEKMTSLSICVRYGLPVSLSFLKRVWGGENGERKETVKATRIQPAKIKWDADAVKQEKGAEND
ncbi:MAG: hypothetical protein IKQ97_04890 [Eubacterium sp.]|nr:hypothetical protein [Eubacterium sp.]